MARMRRKVVAPLLTGLLVVASPAAFGAAGGQTGCGSPGTVAGAMPSQPRGQASPGTRPHEVHVGRQGGTFFMAPDKIHHVEGRYSLDCGMELFLYDAYTRPLGVGGFQAFYKIVPEDAGEWEKEVIRFLSPAAEGAMLHAGGGHDIAGPYRIELYVKFPDSDDAVRFDIPVGSGNR